MLSSHLNITGYPGIATNITSLDQCTPLLCSLDYAVVQYIPSTAGNTIFAGFLAVLLAIQLSIWFLCRTHSFTSTMCSGLALEILGYVARTVMGHQLFVNGPFLV
jgi:hypothetical protein